MNSCMLKNVMSPYGGLKKKQAWSANWQRSHSNSSFCPGLLFLQVSFHYACKLPSHPVLLPTPSPCTPPLSCLGKPHPLLPLSLPQHLPLPNTQLGYLTLLPSCQLPAFDPKIATFAAFSAPKVQVLSVPLKFYVSGVIEGLMVLHY
jgi:hypothetical protein